MLPRRRLLFACSLDYARHTGGYVYNTRLVAELAQRGWHTSGLDLPAGFPRPDRAAREQSATLLRACAGGALIMADQICFSPLADVLSHEAKRLRLVMIFHHPIAKEEGLVAHERAAFMTAERTALAACRLVVATSHTTARTLVADYGVPRPRVVVAPPGMMPRQPSCVPCGPVERLLSVGAVIPRKGYHVLIEALAGLRTAHWTLDIVGDLERAPDYVSSLRRSIRAAGLDERVHLRGAVSADVLEHLWQAAHVYVAASLHEGYGMALAEAVARGLPTVSTGAGAVEEWLDPSAALIVPTGAPSAMRNALKRVLTEPALRQQLSVAALAQAAGFATWQDTAKAVDQALAAI